MIFEQIVWRDLGCASYLVGCQAAGEAVVVDPPLDVREVLALCARHGAKLVGVVETHTHADHVSGHGILAQQHGCWIAIHEIANAVYEHRPLRDGDRIDVGNISLDVLHTPGHRPEHCCLAVSDRTRARRAVARALGRRALRRRQRPARSRGRRRRGRSRPLPLAARAPRGARRRRGALPRARRRLALRARHVGQDLLDARLRAPLQPDARRDDGRAVRAARERRPRPEAADDGTGRRAEPRAADRRDPARAHRQAPGRRRSGTRRPRRRRLRGRAHPRLAQRLRRRLRLRQSLRLRARLPSARS